MSSGITYRWEFAKGVIVALEAVHKDEIKRFEAHRLVVSVIERNAGRDLATWTTWCYCQAIGLDRRDKLPVWGGVPLGGSELGLKLRDGHLKEQEMRCLKHSRLRSFTAFRSILVGSVARRGLEPVTTFASFQSLP